MSFSTWLWTAAARGHQVTLLHASAETGGKNRVQAAMPGGGSYPFIFEYQRNRVNNGSITNAVTLDPQTLAIAPFNTVLTTPQHFTRLNPRVDYQLNDRNTMVFSYDVTRSDIRDAGIGGFNLISRGYHVQYTDQTAQVTETAVLGATVNETRFQYYRTASQIIANSLSPEITTSPSEPPAMARL